MKAALFTFLFLACHIMAAQTVKVSGTLMYADCDTFTVTLIGDDGSTATTYYTGIFWTAYLHAGTNYFLVHECANKRKVLNVKTGRMDIESIEIDIDFSSRSEATIYLEKKSSKYYTLQVESAKFIRATTIQRIRNEY